MALIYRSPRLYELTLRIIHGTSLAKRYEFIAQEVGKGQRVFEPGCGTCVVVPYLHEGCSYEGWDLNDAFLQFGRKKHVKVEKRDIFDFERYPENDVIIICDVLHHVVPEHVRLVKGALERTKKLIVSEPARSFKPPRILYPLLLFLNRTIGDYDGINPASRTFLWDYSREKLCQFYQAFGCVKIVEVGWDMIAIFERSNGV